MFYFLSMKIYTFHLFNWSGQLGSEMSMQTQMLSTKDAELKGAREEVHSFLLVLLRYIVACLGKSGCISHRFLVTEHELSRNHRAILRFKERSTEACLHLNHTEFLVTVHRSIVSKVNFLLTRFVLTRFCKRRTWNWPRLKTLNRSNLLRKL